MLHVDRRDRLQYGNMADNSGAERSSSRLYEIVRKRRALWWVGGAVLLIALVTVTWLARKWIPLSAPHKWIPFPSDWFMPLSLGAGALLMLAILLAILWKVPQWQVGRVKRLNAKERFDRVNEARKTLATILGGIVLLAGFFGTWQNIKVAQESLTVSQQGQITDRFTKAIEQLGAVDASGKKKLEVRLGGIYALERIANDSERDHWPIMEVLTAYVRENAPAPRKSEHPLSEERKPKKSAQENQASAPPSPLPADIQAILTVLGRRDTKYERKDQHLDLSETDLRGAYLEGANLRGALLFRVLLSDANLIGATLHYADLSGADLSRASLSRADLSEANPLGAQLHGAFLDGANLRGAMLMGADLSGASLSRADLTGAILNGAHFTVGTPSGANLSGANLSAADLRGADLRGARYLTQRQIDAALGDSGTKLPKDQKLRIPDKWKPGTATPKNDNRRQVRLP
jgi:uncharacterized protein YjbI with pentapeptide repeats